MPSFGSKSKAALAKCHPLLQDIANEAIKEIDFMVLDATRGRVEQERAFAGGKSKARFGQSAHNYVPAIAFDLFPAPYDWNNTAAFIALSKVIMRIAKEEKIPLRWGGDWNRDGDKTTSDAWDKPHYELDPWRDWAKKSKLYEG
ncbi:peptidoglycan L-alanyl-D-glutamate endopeptidase CwlK [Phyllobacterium sp. CL33Tsu]|uniref:M15 family metallopeptidase n=1 Tax=Phyllobacterium sp. CL33Tsu TaxID=1798191 RepID=UPI0008EE8518|nr:M15 family metallopeptidase [Phyllobacterium sp. CL33Tsu]SFJ55297.1 peptidoglycan L-alanyl-D-glutamate endopeptidase CwlK [Phyllobacterium sp. CL33Tsu]